jgi:putative membrane protein
VKTDEVVPNVDSTARDHLANERTFLAWVRTALGFIGLGLVIDKLTETHSPLVLATGFVLVAYGAVVLVYAIVRYERVARLLQAKQFRVAKRGPWVLGLFALLVALAAFGVLMFAPA